MTRKVFIAETKVCQICANEFVKPYGHGQKAWISRRFCSLKCKGAAKTAETAVYRKANAVDAVYVRDRFNYDPETGIFTIKKNNKPIGHKISIGYIKIEIHEKAYAAHRLAWLYVYGEWPKGWLDHKDLDRANNAISNLRETTPQQNVVNCRARKNKSSSLKGAYKENNRWRSIIRYNGKNISLGSFKTEAEANAAYLEAAKKFHGEFARAS